MRASGVAIALWFFFVLVFDLLLMGALVATGGAVAADTFPFLPPLNPADIFRILNIFSLEDVRTMYGLATVFPARLANPACSAPPWRPGSPCLWASQPGDSVDEPPARV